MLAYDALALNAPFINECINLNIDAVIRVKKRYILSGKNVKRITNKKDHIHAWYDNDYRIKASESIFYMTGVEQQLRHIKFAKKHRNGDRSQVLIIATAMDMSVKTVYGIMKARWNIENRVFNNLKNNANLNHCFVHGGNAIEAVLYLMFMASNLFQLFKVRRLKNHILIQKELVRLLLKGLYFYRSCNDYILDTG
ncbi:MAG: transposase [Eubacteriales bacterium]